MYRSGAASTALLSSEMETASFLSIQVRFMLIVTLLGANVTGFRQVPSWHCTRDGSVWFELGRLGYVML